MNSKMQLWTPWLTLINFLGTIVVGIVLGLYIHLPTTVAGHTVSIEDIKARARVLELRQDAADQTGSVAARVYMEEDKRSGLRRDQEIAELRTELKIMAGNWATVLERLDNLVKSNSRLEAKIDKHMEAKP